MMKLVMSVVVLLSVGAAQDLMSPTFDIISELQKIKTMEEKLSTLYDEVKELRSKNDAFLSALKSSVSDLASSVASLTSKQQTCDAPVTCKSGWISYKSSCFLLSSNALNWTEARDYCKAQGALLLKIQDDDREWAFLNHHTIPTPYWVGLTDQSTGQWRWVDDTPYTMNKERWNPGQPDDWKQHGLGEEGEDCAAITVIGKLNDSHCSIKQGFICRVQF
ncbi:asialoglycoprotein receptor 1-like [Chanodichthys erythropterus]|uniref:asialoglycoprotein receptor 1-like n=1 Tax=Chanodichthys erythropterus TaxID=933992 RepID=UPI00351E0C31